MAKYLPLPAAERALEEIPDAKLGQSLKEYIGESNNRDWEGFNKAAQLSTIRKFLDNFLSYVRVSGEMREQVSGRSPRRR